MATNKGSKMKIDLKNTMSSILSNNTIPANEIQSPSVSKKNTNQEKEDEYGRITYIVKKNYQKKVKILAMKDNTSIRDVVNAAIGEYLAKYEKENGALEL